MEIHEVKQLGTSKTSYLSTDGVSLAPVAGTAGPDAAVGMSKNG